jgi:RND family efflux transporter MFP subunit
MNKKLQRVLPIILLVVSAIIAWQILENPSKARKTSETPEIRLRVKAVTVEVQSFTPTVQSFGEIKAKVSGSLIAEVPGKLTFLSPKLVAGGKFQQGDKLAQIDSRSYEAELIVAEGNLAEANFKLEEEIALGQQAEANWKKIGQSKAATSLALRKPHLVAAKAQFRSAEALLDLARLNLEKTSVVAPYAGKVQSKYIDVGQYLASNAVLADIFASEALEVRLPVALSQVSFLNLPSSDASTESLKTSSLVLMATQGFADSHWDAKLTAVENVLDPQSKQLNLIAEIKQQKNTLNSVSLKLGLFVKASIQGRQLDNVFVIPRSALYQSDTVYLAESERLVKRKVTLIWSDEKHAVLTEGLRAGEALIITPLGKPITGTLLSIEQPGSIESHNAAD